VDISDVLGRNGERVAVEDDEVGKFADLQGAGDVVLMEFVSGVNRGGAKNRLTREAGIVAEPAVVFGRSGGGVCAGDADFESEPFIESVDGPIAAKSDASASGGEPARGFDDFHALGTEVVDQAERVSGGLFPLHGKNGLDAELAETREIGWVNDFGVSERGTNVGRAERFAHGCDGVERRADGAIAVSVHMRINTSAAEADENFRERSGGEVDVRAETLTGNPARSVLSAGIHAIRLDHGAGHGGCGDDAIEEEFCVADGDGGLGFERALIVFIAIGDDLCDGGGRIGALLDFDERSKVSADGEFAGGLKSGEGIHAGRSAAGVEKGSDALMVQGCLGCFCGGEFVLRSWLREEAGNS